MNAVKAIAQTLMMGAALVAVIAIPEVAYAGLHALGLDWLMVVGSFVFVVGGMTVGAYMMFATSLISSNR